MEEILVTYNKHWRKEKYSGIFNREVLNSILNKLKLKEIQILIGIRRSGKSTLFKLLINYLSDIVSPESILYLNCDDPYFTDLWKDAKELYRIVETAEKITGKAVLYLFLDEVQNIKNWEKFVKSVYDSEKFKKIFITGSNSNLLQGDYARLLSGRYVLDQVFPLSFKEILKNNGINEYIDLIKFKTDVQRLFENILFYGSFPELLKTDDAELKREILIAYYESIILKDCIVNHNIRDVRTFKNLTFYLSSNISSLYSYNSLAKAIESNENTVKDFISIIEDSLLMKEIRQFSYSIKNQTKSKKKIYSIDNGITNTISFKFSENRGKLFENLIYSELIKNGYNEIYFSQKQKECDFIIRKNKEYIALQVAYEINNKNRDREILGLCGAMEEFNIKTGFIVTFDMEEKIKKNIYMIPFWKIYKELLG